MHWTVAKLVEATRGELLQGSVEASFNAVSTDTRSLRPGDCFVALPGETHDGHDFIPQAIASKAGAVLLSRLASDIAAPPEVALVKVGDTLYALGEMARAWRSSHRIPVVGITGSNGKTSTKEMVAAILGVDRQVHKNAGNFNNLIGVPLTLLSLRSHHQVAVIEMGINVFGEMQRLLEIVQPTIGLVTNIHPAHLQGLGSTEKILQEKGKLLASLGEHGLAIVNMDDDRLRGFSKAIKARTISYSLKNSNADVHLSGAVQFNRSVSQFNMAAGGEVAPIQLPVLGLHHVQNALAAAAVGFGMGMRLERIAEGLGSHQPVRQRMEVRQLEGGAVLVDDTYNANPQSVLAAVRAVLEAGHGKPVIAVLGEMREMGTEGAELHRQLGRQIGAMGISKLITLGDLAAEIGEGAREVGLSAAACHHAQDYEEIVDLLQSEGISDKWILVKGSRGMTMERVVQGLTDSRER